jgi:hypothetical protein
VENQNGKRHWVVGEGGDGGRHGESGLYLATTLDHTQAHKQQKHADTASMHPSFPHSNPMSTFIKTWRRASFAPIPNAVVCHNWALAGLAPIFCGIWAWCRPLKFIKSLSNVIFSHTLIYHHNHTLPNSLQRHSAIVAPARLDAVLHGAAVNDF